MCPLCGAPEGACPRCFKSPVDCIPAYTPQELSGYDAQQNNVYLSLSQMDDDTSYLITSIHHMIFTIQASSANLMGMGI